VHKVAAATVLAVLLAGCGASSPGSATAPDGHATGGAGTVQRHAIQFDTEAGVLTILLYPEAAPKTVALLEQYVREGYYAGRSFTRTVPGHVIQVTDATGGMTDDARTVPVEANATFHFSAGAAGIARGADPNSGGPEFFLMDYATSHLDGNYTVWGQVLAGLDVVHDIASRPAVDLTPANVPGVPVGPPTDRMALVPVRIVAARLLALALPRAEAAHFPLQVARNVRVGDLRHSLEWPADLHAGSLAQLTWYVRPYRGAAVPTSDLVVSDGSGPLPLGTVVPGIIPFTWAPTAGPHVLTLSQGGQKLAELAVQVPSGTGRLP
jgi:peptidylprolyl isomerase